MSAYRRVDDLSHLRADCLYTGIAPGPTLGNEYGKPYLFHLYKCRPSYEDRAHHKDTTLLFS